MAVEDHVVADREPVQDLDPLAFDAPGAHAPNPGDDGAVRAALDHEDLGLTAPPQQRGARREQAGGSARVPQLDAHHHPVAQTARILHPELELVGPVELAGDPRDTHERRFEALPIEIGDTDLGLRTGHETRGLAGRDPAEDPDAGEIDEGRDGRAGGDEIADVDGEGVDGAVERGADLRVGEVASRRVPGDLGEGELVPGLVDGELQVVMAAGC